MHNRWANKGFIDKEIILGVRPEDVIMSLTKVDDCISTKVYVVEGTGSYNIIDVVLKKEEKLRVRTQSTVEPAVNDLVYLNFDMDRITVFDPESEDSIM